MTQPQPRFGITVPPAGAIGEQQEYYRRLVRSGYTDVWTGESGGYDGVTPLVLAGSWAPELRLGTAILPVFTRGPGLLAQTAATMVAAFPGRFVLGIGSSSNVIVHRWNAQEFVRPFSHTRDMVRFLKKAFTGEKVKEAFDTFEVDFRLNVVPKVPPLIMVAALRERMLRLAGTEADGVILNWLSAEDVRKVTPLTGAEGETEVICRIFVCPSEDGDAVRAGARRFIAEYLNVPVYADYHRWLGRGQALEAMQERWQAGDRTGALGQVPDEVVDELIVHGSPEQCAEHIQRYVKNGVTTPVVALMGWGHIDDDAVGRLVPPHQRPAS